MATVVSDNFNDNSIERSILVQPRLDAGCAITETNQRMEISMPDNTTGVDTYASITTVEERSAIDTILTVKVVDASIDLAHGLFSIYLLNASGTPWTGWGIDIAAAGYGWFYDWDDDASAGNFYFITGGGGLAFPLWYRLTIGSSTTLLERSSDGTSYSTVQSRATVANALTTTDILIMLEGATIDAAASAVTYKFDDFSWAESPSPIPRAPPAPSACPVS